jgi:hypothetical protein
MTKLIVAVRNSANVPKNYIKTKEDLHDPVNIWDLSFAFHWTKS